MLMWVLPRRGEDDFRIKGDVMGVSYTSHRKHTPIVSEAQRGMFGAEYARRKKGKKGRMKGITVEELRSHLMESGGKKLPKRSRGG